MSSNRRFEVAIEEQELPDVPLPMAHQKCVERITRNQFEIETVEVREVIATS